MNASYADVLDREVSRPRRKERKSSGHSSVPMMLGALSGMVLMGYSLYHVFQAVLLSVFAKAN